MRKPSLFPFSKGVSPFSPTASGEKKPPADKPPPQRERRNDGPVPLHNVPTPPKPAPAPTGPAHTGPRTRDGDNE